MRYWGVDIGQKLTALACRNEAGEVTELLSCKTMDDVVIHVNASDAVVVEWTGGKARPLLERLWASGCKNLYIYKGSLKYDRLHLGYQIKGDLQDAQTLSYALWASLTKRVPFRPNALIEYGRMREVYELRTLYYQCEALVKESVRIKNRAFAYFGSGIGTDEVEAWARRLEAAAEQKYQQFRLACMENEDVRRVLAVLQSLFPTSERAVYGLAVQLAPLDRFGSVAALFRYSCLLPNSGTSGGDKVVSRSRWRGGNRFVRVLLYRLLSNQLRIGDGNGKGRGRWRDYYDGLRRRMGHGAAMIRMMHRCLRIIYRLYFGVNESDLRVRVSGDLRREQFLKLVADGFSDSEACKAIGVHRATVGRWKRDEQFLERYVRARVSANGGGNDECAG